MLFNSPLYGAFLVATFAVFWILRRGHRARVLFLIAASYAFYFYGTFDAARDEPVPLTPLGWSAMCLGIIFVGAPARASRSCSCRSSTTSASCRSSNTGTSEPTPSPT
jgi:D-alanyl-lipoteichoic acid acyltransferase DltB (MBOAT superfamily)